MPKLDAKEIKDAAKAAVAIWEESAPTYITFERYINDIENYLSVRSIKKPAEISNMKKDKNALYNRIFDLCYYLNFYYDRLCENNKLYKDDKKPEIIKEFSKNNEVDTPEKDFATKSDEQKEEIIEKNIKALQDCTNACKAALKNVNISIKKYKVQKVPSGEHNINNFLKSHGIGNALKFLN